MNKIKSFVLSIGVISSFMLIFPLVISCGGKGVEPEYTGNMPTYKTAGYLKSDDKWWNLDSGDTYTNYVEKGIGSTYYIDTELKNGSWPQYNLDDWINTYDTSFDDLLNDKNHPYAATSPNKYDSNLKGYLSIYNSDPLAPSAQVKTGNNNNGLNGIYSGAAFGVYKDASRLKKIFDFSIIETINDQPFSFAGRNMNGWEHVNPASNMGTVFDGHRKSVSSAKYPNKFKKAIGDLHNLRPSLQDPFNSPRSNNLYGIVPGNSTKYGVDFETGYTPWKLKVAEPRVNVRGDVARILFYMHDRYHINYDKNYYKLLTLWAAMDPVTKEERSLDIKIAAVMGYSNDYVTGKKKIPYDQEIEQKILNANKDNTPNSFSWG